MIAVRGNLGKPYKPGQVKRNTSSHDDSAEIEHDAAADVHLGWPGRCTSSGHIILLVGEQCRALSSEYVRAVLKITLAL